jgi:CheY-like chemotaxis protein
MSQKRILIAEDEPKDAFLLEHMFRNLAADFELVFVPDGEKAIAYLKACGQLSQLHPIPDVLLVDLKMPGVDGFGVLQWVSVSTPHRQMLRVVLTGSEDPEHLRRAYALGANAYLRKPVTKMQLETLTNMLLADAA